MLEQIRILQQRINDLQNPSTPRQPQQRMPSSSSAAPSQMPLGPLLSYFHSQQTSGTNVSASSAMAAEVPPIVLQALAHNFLHNASSFGFFLDTQAFHEAIQNQTLQSNLPSVLLNVMHLWGIHLSTDARIARYEPALLARALDSTASSLTSTHPRTLLHGAQAEVLLATYFLRNGRMVEGRYHISAAVGIVLSGRWNQIQPASNLDELRERREQVAAFWNVLTIDGVWAGIHDWAPNVIVGPGGLDIQTSLPADDSNLRAQASVFPVGSDGGTLARFMADLPDHPDSPAALHAKAGILLATAAMGRPGSPVDAALDRRVAGFVAGLPAIQSKTTLITHLLARLATIRLHLSVGAPDSRAKVLAAAREVVGILMDPAVAEEVKGGIVDPIIAPILARTARVFITELAAVRASGSNGGGQGLLEQLKFLVQVMQIMAPRFTLMASQLETIRQACGSARIPLA
ncbi:Zn(2)-C6 fungal-type domain-containing protein [Mycena indigotica]|uniref:Zn(2)-C6 fungal-type domain-containing protein n=1 Tax=Mycena indigotica TaxID=2126181 RepID=A0A8H6T1J8_9AGAR|nr:Zn(2)-C6 fungal-type domain-containing protein [Mycena indigotica]KAF7309308.1 Zn(2)-C6 fungal-type domain-containing protein [Mycena indigotica]